MRMKHFLTVILVCAIFSSAAINTFAEELPNEPDSGGERVIQIMIPDGSGGYETFQGEQAEEVYAQLMAQTIGSNDVVEPRGGITLPDSEKNGNNVSPRGMFTYKYRFVKSASGTVYGTSQRISTYAGNATSVQQSKELAASASTTWSIDVTLTGKLKEVFEAAVGGSWEDSSSFSESLTVNVAPKKRVWLEFKPLYDYVSGKAEKYYETRGPISTTVVEESKAVYSKSPRTITITLAGKSFKAPDGAYIWKEDSNYNSN